jgi:hypothetical protein
MRLLLVIALVLPVFGEEPRRERTKVVWEWSAEERLAARFDPASAAKRAVDSDIPDGERLWGRVSGATNPELFLPSELFISLMDGLDSDPVFRATSRAVIRDRIVAFGFNEEAFWRELESATTVFLTHAHRRAGLLRHLDEMPPTQQAEVLSQARGMDADLCATRAVALTRARRQFGREMFDRFLYTVVAPGLSVAAATPSADTPRQLMFVEGGCQ